MIDSGSGSGIGSGSGAGAGAGAGAGSTGFGAGGVQPWEVAGDGVEAVAQSKVLVHVLVWVLEEEHAPQDPQLHVSAVQLGGGGGGGSQPSDVFGEGVLAVWQLLVTVHVLVLVPAALQDPHDPQDHVSCVHVGTVGVMTVVYGVPPNIFSFKTCPWNLVSKNAALEPKTTSRTMRRAFFRFNIRPRQGGVY